ncbi:PhzF family phenazine biosynthesis protein [Actinotalea sp. K2]|uniref:PhzF family phenazine biosynthesis protein n=1 Tax=Actinotalea sp. K2 TaxID=2939438 RepID=UPI002017FA5D|nr:PhzF family phenazine biosynthesis isomerase [Actinotalea sp. K2]MCL3860624.1 PhzF family phenazine biosynthesis protein [Actinotalea sp. K2]
METPASITGGTAGITVLRYAAFTRDGVGGNPAGVVLDASALDRAERLALAAEVGYSETAFVGSTATDGTVPLRFFSPRAEVVFCGHATVATAVALADRDGPGTLTFTTLAGPIVVETATAATGELLATLTSAPTRSQPASPGQVASTLRALRWEAADLDPVYPVHVANAGNDHLVLSVRDRARLAALDYDYPALDALMATEGWTTVHLVHAETAVLFHARDPFPPGGVVEDPATGAAAAAFGGYLRTLGALALPARVTVVQGEDMGSPSRLLVDVAADDVRVRVTGTAARITVS